MAQVHITVEVGMASVSGAETPSGTHIIVHSLALRFYV